MPKNVTQHANNLEKISNVDIAVYALYLCGGESRQIATEDIACKCFELAPDAFSWVKYPQYPDKDVARLALMDARKSKKGCLVRGRAGSKRGQWRKTKSVPSRDGWELTESGAKWLAENGSRLSDELESRQAKSHRQENLQKLAKIRGHILFKKYTEDGNSFNPTLGEMAELFQCTVDSDIRTWTKRFDRATNFARLSNDESVLNFIKICKESLPSKGGFCDVDTTER